MEEDKNKSPSNEELKKEIDTLKAEIASIYKIILQFIGSEKRSMHTLKMILNRLSNKDS